MFDNTSDYALNKKNKDSIIYRGADGREEYITRENFETEEEFLFWKSWSDEDYRITDNADTYYRRNIVGIGELGKGNTSAASPEDVMVSAIERSEEVEFVNKKIKSIMEIITDIQFRRIWYHYALGFKVRAIAKIESVAHSNIVKSIVSAKKIILKNASAEGTKMP